MNSRIDIQSQPANIRKRAREIYLAMGSFAEKYEPPTLQVFLAHNLCMCGCGAKVGHRSNSKLKFRPGHWVRMRWQMAFELAIKENLNNKDLNTR